MHIFVRIIIKFVHIVNPQAGGQTVFLHQEYKPLHFYMPRAEVA